MLNDYACGLALKQMKMGKSPGTDGISLEYDILGMGDIKTFFVISIHFSFESLRMTKL